MAQDNCIVRKSNFTRQTDTLFSETHVNLDQEIHFNF